MLSGFVAVFFLFQALTNTGCCGVNGCALPTTNKTRSVKEEMPEGEKDRTESG
jgi:hypothetical protein